MLPGAGFGIVAVLTGSSRDGSGRELEGRAPEGARSREYGDGAGCGRLSGAAGPGDDRDVGVRERLSGKVGVNGASFLGPRTRKVAPHGHRISLPSTRSEVCSDRPHDGHVTFTNMRRPPELRRRKRLHFECISCVLSFPERSRLERTEHIDYATFAMMSVLAQGAKGLSLPRKDSVNTADSATAAISGNKALPPVLGRLLSATFWLALRVPLQFVFSLWTTRLILEAIGPLQNGAYAFAWGFGFFQFLFEFGASSALQRQISDAWTRGDREGVDRAIACGLNFYTAMAIVQVAALLGVAYWRCRARHFRSVRTPWW